VIQELFRILARLHIDKILPVRRFNLPKGTNNTSIINQNRKQSLILVNLTKYYHVYNVLQINVSPFGNLN